MNAKMLIMIIPPCPTEKYLKMPPIYYSLRENRIFGCLRRSFLGQTEKVIKKEKC